MVLAIFFIWVYAAVLPWRAERLAEAVAQERAPAADALSLPWTGEAARLAAHRLMLFPGGADVPTRDLLEGSILRRPLYAPGWLDLAELSFAEGRREEAARYAKLARQLWPTRGRLLWNLAMLQVRMGKFGEALVLLRDYLAAMPHDVHRTLVLARRLQPDPESLIAELESSADTRPGREELLKRMLDSARWSGDAPLAQAVWRRLPDSMVRDRQVAFPYVAAMVQWNKAQAAIDAWRAVRGTVHVGDLENGGFEQPLLDGGFGWRHGDVKGASWTRDGDEHFEGRYSLRVDFDGTENVHYRHFAQTVPVEPGRTYQLTGFWRGENITTRSGVFVDAYSIGGKKSTGARIEARRQSWDWSRFGLKVTIPPDARFLVVGLRRDRTDALDHLIAGRVWLDALELRPLSGDADIAAH
jgi:hypothetical protein